jgi:ribosome biogenesis GTPase A
LQAEAESIVAQKKTSTAEEDHDVSSSDSVLSVAKHVVVGFVGYPNVGKSSTINVLVGEKRTGVTHTPGKTEHFQTLIISEELTLCDCPGIILPCFSTSRHELSPEETNIHKLAVINLSNKINKGLAAVQVGDHDTIPFFTFHSFTFLLVVSRLKFL